jgi:4-hydroxybenzoate polyprenyltransferase
MLAAYLPLGSSKILSRLREHAMPKSQRQEFDISPAQSNHLGSSQRSILYHLYTIYLFTATDFKTIIIPTTMFGILGSLSPSLFTSDDAASSPSLSTIYPRAPLIFTWVFLNTLLFALHNQRQPSSISEDALNKPWRPLPSKRLTPREAHKLLFAVYTACIAVSLLFGAGLRECLALIALGYWYNDLGGADRSCVERNLLNASGYAAFNVGAVKIATANINVSLSTQAQQWFGMIILTIFTTMHAQDLEDQVGDASRNRKTVPLVIGDANARWSLAVMVPLLSVLLPAFWKLGAGSFAVPVVLGLAIAGRFMGWRSVDADRLGFKLWNLWILVLYALPLLRRFEI